LQLADRRLNILLVRLRQIGDVVFTTPAVRALRQRFPDSHISYVVEPAAAPIVADNPNIDEVIVAPRTRGVSGLRAEVTLVRRLRRTPYDLAIDFHGGPRASLLTWLSGAPVRVGYDVAGRGWMYTRRVARPRELRARHSVLNQWDLLAPFDIAPPEPGAMPVEMPVDREAAVSVDRRLAGAGAGPGDQLIVLHVSAGNPFRRWPIASFAAVAAELAGSDGRRRVVLTSGPSEGDAAERVIAEARARLSEADRNRVLTCGEFSLAELRALVDRAALYIGGDSGPLHVAATTHVPIVGLYGPTLPARSAPWRTPLWPSESVETNGLPCRPCDQRSCEPGDFRCLTWIQPQQVIDAAHRALGNTGKNLTEP
jgi:lipopolysaccharide heptosyltransferase II